MSDVQDDDEVMQFYDSEQPIIQRVTEKLEARKHLLSIDQFAEAAKEEFGLAGYKVDVVFKPFPSGMYLPKVIFRDRLPNHPLYRELKDDGFDHDKKRWEVQQDILGTGTPGAITPDGTVVTPSKSTAFTTPKD